MGKQIQTIGNEKAPDGNLNAKVENIEQRLAAAEKWQQHQEKRQKQQKRDKIVQTGIGLAAPVTSGIAFIHYLGNTVKNFGEFVGETYEAAKVADRLLKPNAKETEVKNYIAKIDSDVGKQYLEHRNESYLSKLEQATRLALDAGGRASEKFPTAQTKPGKRLRDAKAWVIEKTKSLGKSEEREEEIAITNTKNYQDQYNKLSAIRLAAVGKLRELNSEIEKYCEKLAINEVKKGEISGSELKTLEKLVKQYNDIAEISNNTSELSVREISEGLENKEYKAIVEEARDYGITVSDFSNYGNAALIIGTLGVAYLGHKIAKPVTKLAQGAYKLVSKGIYIVRGKNKNNKA